jgi:hypothetical protein
MNPYEVSPIAPKDAQGAVTPCMRCGSMALTRDDPRFPEFGLGSWICYGWAIFIFRYSFLMPSDTCQDCGTRFHFKPWGSLITMLLVFLAIFLACTLIDDAF